MSYIRLRIPQVVPPACGIFCVYVGDCFSNNSTPNLNTSEILMPRFLAVSLIRFLKPGLNRIWKTSVFPVP